MIWFKHACDNHRGQSVQMLLDEHGYFGPFVYYTIYELCAEKLYDILSSDNACIDPVFRLHRRVVCSVTRAKPSSICCVLVTGQICGLLSFNYDGTFFEFKIPILLKLLNRDSKSARTVRASNAYNARLDKDKDKDKDKEYISSVVGKTTTEQDLIFLFLFKNIKIEVEKNLYEKWIEIYSHEFVTHELKQIETWLMINKHKAPRKDFKRFINNWLNRGWESYRKKLDTKKSIMNFVTAVD